MKPAVTREQWAQFFGEGGYTPLYATVVQRNHDGTFIVFPEGEGATFAPHELPGLIALANAALPDDDKRKFRREHIAALRDATLRDVIGDEDTERTGVLRTLARALESYLPPEDA